MPRRPRSSSSIKTPIERVFEEVTYQKITTQDGIYLHIKRGSKPPSPAGKTSRIHLQRFHRIGTFVSPFDLHHLLYCEAFARQCRVSYQFVPARHFAERQRGFGASSPLHATFCPHRGRYPCCLKGIAQLFLKQ
jgi:hypothetical protein